MEFALVLLILLFAALAGTVWYSYRTAFYPKVRPWQETLRIEIEEGRLLNFSEVNAWDKEEIKVRSNFGYDLFGILFPVKNPRGCVVLSHGITYSLCGSLKYAALFRSLGFTTLVYDNRFHGRSGGPFCSYGWFEKQDLKLIVDWVENRMGKGVLIGTHGESLGAAITLQHAAIDQRVSFLIPDCAYSDIYKLMALRMQLDYHLPPIPLLPLTRWLASLVLRFDIADASPIRTLQDITAPILFIHGDADTYIPMQMCKDMYELKQGDPRNRLYLAKGAEHAASITADRQKYAEEVESFLRSNGFLQESLAQEAVV